MVVIHENYHTCIYMYVVYLIYINKKLFSFYISESFFYKFYTNGFSIYMPSALKKWLSYGV